MAAHHHHHHHHHHDHDHDHDHELMDEKTSRESNKNNNNMMVTSSTTSFCYPDVVVHPPHNLGFSNHGVENFESNPEIYNLTSGIEMIGFQPKNQNQNQNQNLMVAQQQQQQQQQEMGFMDESSLRPCVFPCEGNERPSQGLSLSLSSSNPSTISLQSFELRHNNSRDLGFMRKLSHQSFHQRHQQQHQHQHQQQQQVFLGSSSSSNMSMQFEMMRSSKYMGPTQELLSEFCNLGTKQNNHDDPPGKKQQQLSKKNKHQWEHLQDQGINNHDDDDHHHLTNHSNNNNNNNNNSVINDSNNNANSSTSRNVNPSLYGVSLMELQKRKTKLLAMLEELDKRYKHYCEQMKGVVCSFEAVAGPGAADVYSALASKAMSRHFRCLRDAIVAQIMSTKKAMGEKDANNNASILGTTKGETPRLRVLDQNLRQQRAYQQMTMMESHPWRPQRGLPERSVSILRAWLFEHFLHPYPSDVDKHILARQTGLSRGQVSNWFINARVRLWKPMVEQMYLEETKEDQDTTTLMGSSSDHNNDHLGGLIQPPPQPPPPPLPDQKPNHDQLIRIIDHQDSLSSIINTTTAATTTTTSSGDQNRLMMSNPNVQQSNHYIGRIIQVENFGGSMDNNHLNFASSSSYNHAAYGTNQNDNNAPQQGFGGGNNNNNVSLTLGLQQHGGNNNGVSLAYSPSTHTAAASLFYGREHMEDENCQPVHQFSLLEGDHQTQNNLPYRNLMGAQVLHDFT